MAEYSVYNLRDSEIKRFLVDVGKDPEAFHFVNLDDLCRDIMVMTGNFFKPTGFVELCDDYGVIAFSKDISEQAMTDALLAVKNPEALKKMNKYYPPYNIFLHMTTTVLNNRADPTSLLEEDIVQKIWGMTASLYGIACIDQEFDYEDPVMDGVLFPNVKVLLETMQKFKNVVYVTPFGVVLLENTEDDKGVMETTLSVVRFTKNGKYTYADSGVAKLTEDDKLDLQFGDIPVGKNHELQKTHLNAKAFPRSFACVSAYHTFVSSYGTKITKEQSLMAHRFSKVVNNIFVENAAGEQRSTYITIDLSVPRVITFLLLMTVAAYYTLGSEYEIS